MRLLVAIFGIFFGQIVSLIGTWVQQVALSWIAYRITGSALILGLVARSGQIPMLIATPLGGYMADRYSKRNILLYTQVVEMLVAIALSVVAWQDGFSIGCADKPDVSNAFKNIYVYFRTRALVERCAPVARHALS